MRTAILLTLATLGGSYSPAHAGDSSVPAFFQDDVPFKHSRYSVSDGIPLKIGDLSVVSELEADSIARSAPLDHATLARCIEAAPDYLEWSEDGTSIDFKGDFRARNGAIDQVLTAYCIDGNILLGGVQTPESEDGWQEWIFLKVASWHSPLKASELRHQFAVGPWPHHTLYRLNEVRAIDSTSRRILFAGTSEAGDKALLAAPFAIVTGAAARR